MNLTTQQHIREFEKQDEYVLVLVFVPSKHGGHQIVKTTIHKEVLDTTVSEETRNVVGAKLMNDIQFTLVTQGE